MKLTISYAELQGYVASHFHKTVNVGYVMGKPCLSLCPSRCLALRSL